MSAAENRASARQAARKPQEQSAAAPSPFPAIADYAFLSNCHTGALVAPDGSIDWLCVPRFELAERVRQPARPAGRKFSLRTLRDQPSDNADLRAWHERPGHDLEIAVRLDCCPRRVDDRPPGSRRQDHTPHPASRRRRRRPSTGANGPLPRRQRRDRAHLRTCRAVEPKSVRKNVLVILGERGGEMLPCRQIFEPLQRFNASTNNGASAVTPLFRRSLQCGCAPHVRPGARTPSRRRSCRSSPRPPRH